MKALAPEDEIQRFTFLGRTAGERGEACKSSRNSKPLDSSQVADDYMHRQEDVTAALLEKAAFPGEHACHV